MNRSARPIDVCGLAETVPVPSRHDNPFATCWTRPGALEFRFTDNESCQQLLAKLAAQNWWGAIVGPHGSGKSTLLETLKPSLATAEHWVQATILRDGQRHLPADVTRFAAGVTLIIVDGYEQLGQLDKWRLKRRCRRASVGLLVTTHAPIDIPTLTTLTPNAQLIHQLVADLASQVSTPVARDDVAASHARHGSNVREIFFDLYDRHERLRRPARTLAATRA